MSAFAAITTNCHSRTVVLGRSSGGPTLTRSRHPALRVIASTEPMSVKSKVRSMSDEGVARAGNCRCGDIRFEITGQPVLVEYCHCRSCRHSAGAPVMAWAGFDRNDVCLIHGEPTSYQSSSGVIRTFCGRCGSSLTLADERFPDEVYVALASFDDARAPSPEVHIWRSERLPWLETTDDLPRYVQFKSDGLTE